MFIPRGRSRRICLHQLGSGSGMSDLQAWLHRGLQYRGPRLWSRELGYVSFDAARHLQVYGSDEPPTPQAPVPLWEMRTPHRIDMEAELARLDPPRKHYQWYNSTPTASTDWDNPAQGTEAFLRGYFHLKSADWEKNDPHPLSEWSARELGGLPEYYIMQKDLSMAQTVAKNMEGRRFRQVGALAFAARPPGLCPGMATDGLPRGFELVSSANRVDLSSGKGHATLRRTSHRGSLHLHQREEGLGQLPAARRL